MTTAKRHTPVILMIDDQASERLPVVQSLLNNAQLDFKVLHFFTRKAINSTTEIAPTLATASVANVRPDLIFLDLNLIDGPGIELSQGVITLQKLRGARGSSKTPVIVISDHAEDLASKKRLQALNVQAYFLWKSLRSPLASEIERFKNEVQQALTR